MGKPDSFSVKKAKINIKRHVTASGETIEVTMVNGKKAHFSKVDPETHRKMRSQAYTYVTR